MCFFQPQRRPLAAPSVHPSIRPSGCVSLHLFVSLLHLIPAVFHKNKTKERNKKQSPLLLIVVFLVLLQAKSGITPSETFQLPSFLSQSAGRRLPSTFNLRLEIQKRKKYRNQTHKVDVVRLLVVELVCHTVLLINHPTSALRRPDRWTDRTGHSVGM